jgi:hypothetical protein
VIFASSFDSRLYGSGTPAIFTLDPRGELRVDPERTREILLIHDPPEMPPADPSAWVLTDRATGLRMVLVVTHAFLAELQPRAEAARAASFEEARDAVRARHRESAP